MAQLLQRGTCAIACANTCEHVAGPVAHVRVWWIVETQFGGLWKHSLVDCGNTKTPSMHHRSGRVTLSQLAFPGESNLNFPWKKSQQDNIYIFFFFFFKCTTFVMSSLWVKKQC